MCRLAIAACLLIVTTWCSTSPSAAAETTVTFSGRVDDVPDPLMTQFQPGMPITGSYTFDESLALANFLGSVTDFRMVIGDYTTQQAPGIRGDITVAATEYVAVSFAEGDAIEGITPILVALQLSNSTPGFDTSSPLPPPVEGLTSPLWTLDFSGLDNSLRLSGTVESIVVPEPSGIVLLSTAFAMVAGTRRGGNRTKNHVK